MKYPKLTVQKSGFNERNVSWAWKKRKTELPGDAFGVVRELNYQVSDYHIPVQASFVKATTGKKYRVTIVVQLHLRGFLDDQKSDERRGRPISCSGNCRGC